MEEEIKEALQNNEQNLAVEKINAFLEELNNISLNITVTRECGSGKSTFVNAFRGIKNGDEGAAPTGCVETTTEVTAYHHPNYPNVILWDLPGVGTPRFRADKYLDNVGLDKFDFFIIISATRFTENNVKLAREIQKMKKKFYFVRCKIDSDLYNEEQDFKTKFDREKTLMEIRQNCIQNLKDEGLTSPEVFLVSSFKLGKFDFPLLQKTLERQIPRHKRDALLFAMPTINSEIITKKKEVFQDIDNRDEGAAPTGCVETTTEVAAYPHPNYPNVTFWDLPGVGTTKFPANKYKKHVGLEKFDFFIIVSATRFRENDVKLAQEIQKMGKRFYFVRSKIDIDLQNEERSQREFDREKTLIKIRENCIQAYHSFSCLFYLVGE
ncbi:interferon-inducible GTPase 1-like [Parambassis ranga]|uniref:Interferon-inducible GTPase 1-like n=1 Tax=Parambassis ranga TaxID=210632 RepID=A0A6P7HCU3_9TELE|nr:interferon-inducible GTPase 1-like [Parambassis ranga]